MSVESLSGDLYQSSIQEDLDLYSQSISTLKNCYAKTNDCEEEWTQTVKDLPKLTPQQKKEILNTALTNYHTFIKTAEFASTLFERLLENSKHCARSVISPHTYITMIGLGVDAKILHQNTEALATVRDHLEILAARVQTVLKGDIDRRLSQINGPLEQLIGAINPSLAGWSLAGWNLAEWSLAGWSLAGWSLAGWNLAEWDLGSWSLEGRSTSALDAAYKTWVSNASDEVKNWTPKIDETLLNSASFGSVGPSFAKLNEALQTLNLTYVDPDTKIGYGANPNQELTESQGKEKESTSPIFKENDVTSCPIETNAKSETTAVNAMQKKVEAIETSSENELSVHPEENDLSSFSEEISSASIEKKLDVVMINEPNSQQPSSNPKVNANEDAFETLKCTTKKEEQVSNDASVPSDKVFDVNESDSKEISSAPIEKKLEVVMINEPNSQQPSSNPKVNAQEDTFEALKCTTKKEEQASDDTFIPSDEVFDVNDSEKEALSANAEKTLTAKSHDKPVIHGKRSRRKNQALMEREAERKTK